MISSRDFVGALEKGLEVIAAFDTASTRLTLSDVASKLGITRAAARRFLLTLVELEYAELNDRYFSLTPKVLYLSRAHLVGNPVFRLAQQVLESVASTTQESASAGVLSGTDILFVARAASPRPVSIAIALGTKFPAFCTAMGKVLLAEMEEPQLRRWLGQSSLPKLAPHTRVEIDQIVSDVRDARELGYATSIEELESGLSSIAVPVKNSHGETILSFGLSIPTGRMSREQMVQEFVPVLNAAALRLSSLH